MFKKKFGLYENDSLFWLRLLSVSICFLPSPGCVYYYNNWFHPVLGCVCSDFLNNSYPVLAVSPHFLTSSHSALSVSSPASWLVSFPGCVCSPSSLVLSSYPVTAGLSLFPLPDLFLPCLSYVSFLFLIGSYPVMAWLILFPPPDWFLPGLIYVSSFFLIGYPVLAVSLRRFLIGSYPALAVSPPASWLALIRINSRTGNLHHTAYKIHITYILWSSNISNVWVSPSTQESA